MTNRVLIQEEYTDLKKKYHRLILSEDANSTFKVYGELEFTASSGGVPIEDAFSIEILIPADYPATPPIAKEVGNRIPKKFHKYSDDSLCLAAPLEVRKIFAENRSLVGFTEKLLIHYLYNFVIWEKTGATPFGELSHGGKGLIEYYKEEFGVLSDIQVLSLLRVLAENNYRGHLPCPCGSGKRMRCCHGKLLMDFRQFQSNHDFFAEYYKCIEYIASYDKYMIKPFLSSKFKKMAEKLLLV
jgi:hypothetical protein